MKKTIRDYDLKSKKVIIRCDFNVPVTEGKITDYSRIDLSTSTIEYALENGAKVILMSHFSRVKTEEDLENKSLKIIIPHLEKKLGTKIKFSKNTKGKEIENLVNSLSNGEVLLMENTRHQDFPNKLESSNNKELAKYWSSLGDLFINNAYGSSHRAHASTVGIPTFINSGIGFLVEKEIQTLDKFKKSNDKPFNVIMGGAKISTKISLIETLIIKADKLFLAGGMAFPFLKVKGYNIGKSLYEDEQLDFCEKLLEKYDNKIVLPLDFVTQDKSIKDIENFDDNTIGYDIGNKTIDLFSKELMNSKKVMWNGPLGMFEDEKFQKGTKDIAVLLSNIKADVLIGGGDSAAAIRLFGLEDKFHHISTGGGATLEYLEGKILPGIEVIQEK